MIDEDGFRPNVGIIIHNDAGRVLWARRVGQDAWQFPQGGIKAHESPVEALYRELQEELGLSPTHVELIGQTRDWLRYRLPRRYIRRRPGTVCIGQKQRWFLLRLLGDEDDVQVDASERPGVRSLEVGQLLAPDTRGGVLQARRVSPCAEGACSTPVSQACV